MNIVRFFSQTTGIALGAGFIGGISLIFLMAPVTPPRDAPGYREFRPNISALELPAKLDFCGEAIPLNDPDVRNDNEATERILSHILEHEELAKNTDPFLLAMVRTGKIPEGGPPPEGPMGPGGPPPQPTGGGAPGGAPGAPGSAQPARPTPDQLNRGA